MIRKNRVHAVLFGMMCWFGPTEVAAQPLATESPVMLALQEYLGSWRAEDQATAEGRQFHFTYELWWFDEGKTIVEMLITQRFADGEKTVLWKGFKGWRSDSGTIYYHGFSPGGRAANGEVELEGELFVTAYDGWGPGGAVVRVRDEFSPVRDGAFRARTLVRPDDTSEWTEVSADRWTRWNQEPSLSSGISERGRVS